MNGISTFPKKWLFKFDGLNLLVDISRYRNTLGFNNSVSFSGNPFFEKIVSPSNMDKDLN